MEGQQAGADRDGRSPVTPTPAASTTFLRSASREEPGALQRLMDEVYPALRELARGFMRGERHGHTLQPTALVNEAYLRLSRAAEVPCRDRGQFLRAAAEAMRRILIEHARARNAQKRGDGRRALEIGSVADLLARGDEPGLLALDEAIEQLARQHPLPAEVVHLEFWAGLGHAEAAQVLGQSERTTRRYWAFARAWLRERLEQDGPGRG